MNSSQDECLAAKHSINTLEMTACIGEYLPSKKFPETNNNANIKTMNKLTLVGQMADVTYITFYWLYNKSIKYILFRIKYSKCSVP